MLVSLLLHPGIPSRLPVGGRDSLTRRKRLLELLGLVGVLEDKGVQVAGAPDLELDLGRAGGLLDARRCESSVSVFQGLRKEAELVRVVCVASRLPGGSEREYIQEASFLRAISMNYNGKS